MHSAFAVHLFVSGIFADAAITQHASFFFLFSLIVTNETPIWGQFCTMGAHSIRLGFQYKTHQHNQIEIYIWIVTIWDKHFYL